MVKIEEYLKYIQQNPNLLEELKELEGLYENYVSKLLKYDQEFVKKFLDAYSKREAVISREMEGEESLAALFTSELEEKHTSLNYVVERLKKTSNLTHDDLKEAHRILMTPDPRPYLLKGEYRKDKAYVGRFDEDRNPIIDYEAIEPEKIFGVMDQILEYCNQKGDYSLVHHPFIKPMILHALTLYYQPFQDGNSRVSRIVHHAKLWIDANERLGVKVLQPALFFSGNYMINRGGYRGKINILGKDFKNAEAWQEWISYNINIMFESFNMIVPKLSKLYDIYMRIMEEKERNKTR